MKKAIYQCILLVTLLLGLNLPALAKIEVEDVLGRHITLETPVSAYF